MPLSGHIIRPARVKIRASGSHGHQIPGESCECTDKTKKLPWYSSTCSYVENSYGTKSPIYDLYGRSRCVGTSIELIVLVESIDETQNEKPTAKNLENFQLCPNCMKFGIHANLIHSSIIYLGRVKNFGLLHVQIGIETPSDVISQPILGLLTR